MIECLLVKILLLILVAASSRSRGWALAEGNGIALSGCQDECGGVKIPFPFGIGDGCHFISGYNYASGDAYRVICDNTSSSTRAKPLLPILGNREVLEINVQDHSIRVSSGAAYDCITAAATKQSVPSAAPNITYNPVNESSVPIIISSRRNTFVSIGCGTTASLKEVVNGEVVRTAQCATYCEASSDVRNGTCDSYHGCCEASVSTLSIPSIHFDASPGRTQPCGYAFVGEIGSYNFSAPNLTATPSDCYHFRVPVVYDWFLISDQYDCSESSLSILADDAQFLTCQCLQGYSGNPYLPYGCQDMNECEDEEMNNCVRQEYCVNKEGGYECQCPNGLFGNGTVTSPCFPPAAHGRGKLISFGISIGTSSVIGFIILYGMYKLIKRRKEKKLREHNFKRNGGLLLQQEISTNDGAINRTKIFSRSELERATDNFNENRVLGRGGQGTVYKGMLTDGTIVAVKKSKKVGENQLAQFINEVVILSQVNHRNIVKLFGCCLETEVPLLVYEFVPNGTLYQHIHHPLEDFQMTWKNRFQIAVECARAVAYLHSSCSSPIYHRDIKSSNILLDDKYKAKISDFGTSRSISIDKTHVTTSVQGTFGYLDPEFFRSSQFNEKSDVYSFGVVLLELMTSKKPIFMNTSTEPRGLATDFVQLMENSPQQLQDILDTQVLQQCSEEEIEALTKLIERCLCLYGKQRPTMGEVAMMLEMIKSQHKQEGNLANEQEIRRQEVHEWNDNMGITNEDIYIDSSTDYSSYSMDLQP